ncbi:hypothetical protein HYU13_03520 [Candidatus Woesearchaeota archaeon]|nr:hypothetical protein [Candidatus Woesearchaeota archaeon]
MSIVDGIKSCITPDGDWNFEEIQKKDPEFWKEWIGLRARGNDPWCNYSRDEQGSFDLSLFEQIYRKSTGE